MEFTEFDEKFEQALRANECITFFCECKVEYSGRAESYLKRGDRIIIIKSDNNLMIHQPENANPINYMKEDTTYEIEKKENHRILKAKHTGLKEFMNIEIFRIYNFMSQKLEDGQGLEIMGTEEDMSDMIKEKPEVISEDFKPLSREEHTQFGFIDVFGHDGNGNLVLVECKRYSAGLDAVQQLRRYTEKIKDLKGVDEVKGVLASPSITENAKNMAEKWGYRWERVEPPKRLEKYSKDQTSMEDFT